MLGFPIWLGTLALRETSTEKILQNAKASPLGETNQETNQKIALKHLLRFMFVRPVTMLCTETIVFSLSIYTAFAYATIFSYFGSASYVLQIEYGFNLREVGLSFISVMIGYVMALAMFVVLDKTLYARALEAGGGFAAPEHRLYSGMAGSVLLPVGLFWLASIHSESYYLSTKSSAGTPGKRTAAAIGRH
jgi:hypothetical protein